MYQYLMYLNTLQPSSGFESKNMHLLPLYFLEIYNVL